MALPRLIEAVRRNHALEHATIALLAQRYGGRRSLVGHSGPNGFSIYGAVETEEVAQAAAAALDRLKRGESDLAISPFCGTNIVVAGLLAGLAAVAAVGAQSRLRRLPRALVAAIWAVLGAQPVGLFAQRYLTTSARVQGMQIIEVRSRGRGYAVRTSIEEGLP